MTAVARAWPEADGLRVLGKFRMPARSIVMGADLLLRPEDAARRGSN